MARKLRVAKTRTDKLTEEQEEDLTGLNPWPDAFESPLQRRALWFAYRDELMAMVTNYCARPDGWWDYEAPKEPRQVVGRCVDPECLHRDPGQEHIPHDVLESDDEWLARLGLLSPAELGYLEARRRDEAERAAAFQRSVEEYEATKRARAGTLEASLHAQ